MKGLLIILALFSAQGLTGQIIDFPDENMENALLFSNVADTNGDGFADSSADLNSDGVITQSEAVQIYGLWLNAEEISNLSGLEYFINIKQLECGFNMFTQIPTQTLTHLERLQTYDTPLTSLDLSQNPALRELLLGEKEFLFELNTSQNPFLEVLFIDGSPIQQLDLSQNTNLKILNLYNVALSEIDLLTHHHIENLILKFDTLEAVDISAIDALYWLELKLPIIDEVDFSGNPLLHTVFLENMGLDVVDFSSNHNLHYVVLFDIQLESLNTTGLENLSNIRASFGSQVPHVDLSTNTNLYEVIFVDCGLQSINVQNGHNSGLQIFHTYDNPDLNCIQVDDAGYANQVLCDGNLPLWCKDETAVYSEDCTLSTPDHTNLAISLYPNPATNFIQLQTELPIESVQIFDLSGSLVLETSTTGIDISHILSGLYFLKVNTNSMEQTIKFVKI